MMQREITYTKYEHPHLVHCYGSFKINEQSWGLALELCQGKVDNLISASRQLQLPEVAYLSRHMMSGLSYLHTNGIIHR